MLWVWMGGKMFAKERVVCILLSLFGRNQQTEFDFWQKSTQESDKGTRRRKKTSDLVGEKQKTKDLPIQGRRQQRPCVFFFFSLSPRRTPVLYRRTLSTKVPMLDTNKRILDIRFHFHSLANMGHQHSPFPDFLFYTPI